MHIDFQPLAPQRLAGNLITTRTSETVHFHLETYLLSTSRILQTRILSVMTIYSIKYTKCGLTRWIGVGSLQPLHYPRSPAIFNASPKHDALQKCKTGGPWQSAVWTDTKGSLCFPWWSNLGYPFSLLHPNTTLKGDVVIWQPKFSGGPGGKMATGLSCMNQGDVYK